MAWIHAVIQKAFDLLAAIALDGAAEVIRPEGLVGYGRGVSGHHVGQQDAAFVAELGGDGATHVQTSFAPALEQAHVDAHLDAVGQGIEIVLRRRHV